MPLARIDVTTEVSKASIATISLAVYDAMTLIANVPEHDKFQIVTRHGPGELIYPSAGYLGMTYTDNIVFIQVTWIAGRSVDVKQRFFSKIADAITAGTDIRREDIIISLVGSGADDWSFGNGVMQYAPKVG